MIVIAYSSSRGYLNMVNRLRKICEGMKIPFKGYNREYIESTQFYRENKLILDVYRGNGYWAWKPYIILDAFSLDSEVVYMDSSIVMSSRDEVVRIMSETIGLSASASPYINCDWTKRDCFREMNCDEEKYWKANQVWAAIVTAKSSHSELVSEWLSYCKNYKAISDDASSDNFPNFVEHRHDQSILTNILIKYDQPLFHNEENFVDDVNYESS